MHDDHIYLPIVLAIGGHDPGGGAGIQADIESIAANGCHATTVVTCLTVQDSCNLRALQPVATASVKAQAEAVLADCQIAAIKLGLLGNTAIAMDLVSVLRAHPEIPIVFDPVLATGGGQDLASQTLLDVIRNDLLPLCSLITPNSLEARRLCLTDLPLETAAQSLLSQGAKAVLITGTHEQTPQVSNLLFDASGLRDVSNWQRLPGAYHGSGCTLASAIAAGLARGLPLLDAVRAGQAYSWQCLNNGFRSGRCQALPNRLFAIRGPHS
jgi:hydroxymethylpyrimidine/phosphomethylpyrimidine kinase